MQNTSNYNLNLVEGTDLVNPPIQFNPNFQTIDAAMFANKEASIGTASEVVTGTVHAIVRANQDADAFRFTATGAWTTGDTMTVDGTSVTVHLSDGTAPLTGAYVIGAEVLAFLNGTLVTLNTSMKSIDPGVTSFNSRTGTVTPQTSDYDSSMIDYDNTLSGLTSTDVQGAIDELASSPAMPSWSLHDTLTGTASTIIPATAKEVLVNVIFGSISFTDYFIVDQATQNIRDGYYTNATNYANATYSWTNTTKEIHLVGASFTTTDYTSTATVYVYIR